jgi:zinc protease
MRVNALFLFTAAFIALAGLAASPADAQWRKRPAAAEAAPPAPAPGPSVEGISEHVLGNGLRVLLFPDQTKPSTTVNITYLVGSRHENYGETGMAHLLEHLLFKGTPTHRDIPGEMKKRGISYNATTWLDRTNYFGSFNADAEVLDWLLALEADRMVNSFVARADLDSEMTVVRNEMEAGENNPFRVLLDRIGSTAFVWHNYGNSTIGARADVENMPIERLQAFYRTYYRPDNATLLVAGRFDPEPTLDRINAIFGAIPRPAEPVPVTYTREPVQDGERSVVVRRVGEAQFVGSHYHMPAGLHADSAAVQVLAEILGDTPTGRLHKALVDSGQATFVSAFYFLLAEPSSLYFFAQVPKEQSVDEVGARLVELVEKAQATPFTEAEVNDARLRLAKQFDLTFNDSSRLAFALSESISQGDWRLFFLQRDRIEQVGLEDVTRVAQAYLKPANRTLGKFIPTEKPDRAEIAEAPAVASLLEGYSGREALAEGEAFDPSPANIEARSRDLQLSSGTRLVLLPKKNRGETVSVSLAFRFGDEASLANQAEVAQMASNLLVRGTTQRSREDIARRLDELKSQLSVFGGAQSVAANITSTREHLPAVMELLAEVLRQPSFPENEFNQLKAQLIASIQSQMTEPQAIAANEMARHFSPFPPGHPNYVASFAEQLDLVRAVTLEQVRAFHAGFYGAGNGEIAAVGDFDAESFAAQAEALFGSWTGARPFVRIPNPVNPVEAVSRRFETPDKANAVIQVRADFAMNDSDPDYAALLLGNTILGGGGLKSRLADRVRQTEGLSYSIGSRLSADAEDQRASLGAFAIAAPENIGRVETAIREELARLLEQGIDEAEFADAVNGVLQSRQLSRSQDASLAGQLRYSRYLGRGMQWAADLEAQIAALDKATVEQTMRRRLGDLQLSVFTAGDFARVEGAKP